MDKVTMYRQGDVVFLRLSPEDAKVVKAQFKTPASLVLKEGEITGHKHEATGNGVAVYDNPEEGRWGVWDTREKLRQAGIAQGMVESTVYLTSDNQIKVVHPEHGTLVLEKGDYLVFSQREYDEGRHRMVSD